MSARTISFTIETKNGDESAKKKNEWKSEAAAWNEYHHSSFSLSLLCTETMNEKFN